jgi:NADH dehydrogenase
VLGGGYVGLYTALRLQRRLRRQIAAGRVIVTVVDPRSYMTYQPFLPEASSGSIEPRHVVVPLRRVLRRCQVLTARFESLDHERRCARIAPLHGPAYDLSYEHVVVAVGSVSRTLPIPGLAEVGIGFKTIEEAAFLRNQVLHSMDVAESTQDPQRRLRALTFCFVGGGYAGTEAFAELADMAESACALYPTIRPGDLRFVLVEALDRILPEVDRDMAEYTVEQMRSRGWDVRLQTRLVSAEGGHVVLDDGERFETDTLVWTAGVKAHPRVQRTGLPLSDRGGVLCTADLQVDGVPGAWAAGDCAAVPDLTQPGRFTAPSAQHAVRQAPVLADNIVAVMTGRPTRPYRHAYAGSVASLGLYRGVAQVYGVKLRGLPAWFMHRTYHLSRVPTVNRKVRVLADWTLALFFRREIVSLGSLTQPFREFREVSARAQDMQHEHD